MTNFFAGTILGFLACAWALDTTPRVAATTLWQHLEEVQQTSATAYQAYDAILIAKQRQEEKQKTPSKDYR